MTIKATEALKGQKASYIVKIFNVDLFIVKSLKCGATYNVDEDNIQALYDAGLVEETNPIKPSNILHAKKKRKVKLPKKIRTPRLKEDPITEAQYEQEMVELDNPPDKPAPEGGYINADEIKDNK